jgi:hypothetical protein
MASLDVAAVTPLLKEVYPDGLPKELVYRNAPLLAILPKDESAESYGKQIHVPIRYGDPQGRSASLTKARAGATASKHAAFDVTLVQDYGSCFVDGEVIDRMKDSKGSFIRALKPEINAAMRQLKNSLVHALYRNGGGAIGQISASSNTATATITLATPSDIRFFNPGQILVVSATDGTSGAVRAGTAVTVLSVNRNTGTVTATGAWNASMATAALDYIFVDGDFNAKLKGMDAWVPASDPGATSFYGVDRSVDPLRLGGIRADYSGVPIEEGLMRALERCAREDAAIDILTMHPLDWTNLAIAMGTRVQYSSVEAFDAPQIGFDTIKVIGPTGKVDILCDPNETPNVMRAIQLDTWTLYSLGGLPKVLDNDGLQVLRNQTTDGVEAQLVYRAALGCDAPGANGRFVIGSA